MMDVTLRRTEDVEPKPSTQLIKRLQSSRAKLTSIIDHIVVNTVDCLRHKGDTNLFTDRILSRQQYEEMLRASLVLREAERHLYLPPPVHRLPNTNVIVNKLHVGDYRKRPALEGNSVVVDEAVIVGLLDMYERFGEVIQRLTEDSYMLERPARGVQEAQVVARKMALVRASLRNVQQESTMSAVRMGSVIGAIAPSREEDTSAKDSSDSKGSLQDLIRQPSQARDASKSGSSTVETADKGGSTTSLQEHSPLFSKSSEEARDTSTSEPSRQRSSTPPDREECPDCKNKIKIQILCDLSESEMRDKDVQLLYPSKSQNDCFKVKLGDRPVSLRLAPDGNSEEEATYCINTGGDEDDEEIKIIVKQCADCCSSGRDSKEQVGGSSEPDDISSREPEPNTSSGGSSRRQSEPDSPPGGTSRRQPESDTFSGGAAPRQPEPETSSGGSTRRQPKPEGDSSSGRVERIQTKQEVTKVQTSAGYLLQKPPCVCELEKMKKRRVPKMEMLVDVNNVDKSSIQEREAKVKWTDEKGAKSMRRRVCSSLELDVAQIDTRLRKKGIKHHDRKVEAGLKKLGVEALLRASRPAKCCREAVLNEEERGDLPYTASLRSLPLVPDDIDVIKESLDISMSKKGKKVKINDSSTAGDERTGNVECENDCECCECVKKKLSYYINLENDSLSRCINVANVLPLFEISLDCEECSKNDVNEVKERFSAVTKEVAFCQTKKTNEIDEENEEVFPVEEKVGVSDMSSPAKSTNTSSTSIRNEEQAELLNAETEKSCPEKFYVLRKIDADAGTCVSSVETFSLPYPANGNRLRKQTRKIRCSKAKRKHGNYLYRLVSQKFSKRRIPQRKVRKNVNFAEVANQRIIYVEDQMFNSDTEGETEYTNISISACLAMKIENPNGKRRSPRFFAKENMQEQDNSMSSSVNQSSDIHVKDVRNPNRYHFTDSTSIDDEWLTSLYSEMGN